MFHIIEPLRVVAALLWPFMPRTAERIQSQLGLHRRGSDFRLAELKLWGAEKRTRPLSRAPALFPRVETQPPPAQEKGREPQMTEKTPEVLTFAEFQKMDLRVGEIQTVEPVPKSKKLLKLTVDIGEQRTVVAGLAEHYTPEDLVGQQVVLVANLQPAKLMGVESQGMVLAAQDESGVHLLRPGRNTRPGSRVT